MLFTEVFFVFGNMTMTTTRVSTLHCLFFKRKSISIFEIFLIFFVFVVVVNVDEMNGVCYLSAWMLLPNGRKVFSLMHCSNEYWFSWTCVVDSIRSGNETRFFCFHFLVHAIRLFVRQSLWKKDSFLCLFETATNQFTFFFFFRRQK